MIETNKTLLMRGHMKKRLLILLMIVTTLFTVSSCGQSEPLVKFDEGSGLFITYGFVPVDDKNTQIISTAVNNSDYEITDLKVTYGIKDSSHTIEESTDSVNSKSSRDLSKVTQNYVHSLDEGKLYISQIDYTVKKDKKTQKITYHPDSDTYDLS